MATIDQTGQCLCGAVKFKCCGKIKMNVFCHCKACSRTRGMSPVHLLGVPTDCFEVTEGADKLKLTNFVGKLDHAFCSECGCGIYQCPRNADFKALFPTNFQISEGACCMYPDTLKAQAHINYENRVSDANDSLPKFKVWPGGQMCNSDGSIIDA